MLELHAPPLDVLVAEAAWGPLEAILEALGGQSMQDPASEFRRIHLLGDSVNRAIYSTLQLRFCFNKFLDVSNAPLHQTANAFLHRLINRHLGNDR